MGLTKKEREANERARERSRAKSEQFDRLHLYEENAVRANVAAMTAVANGLALENVVVIVADVRDPVAAEIARAFGIDVASAAAEFPGQIPTLTACVPRAAAIDGFARTNPTTALRLQSPAPAGRFFVAVVASGGAMLVAPECVSMADVAEGPPS